MTLSVMFQAEAPIPLDVAFEVAEGELLALVGHSGSGKTTILRSIAGLWRPERAHVSVSGETWLDTDRGVAMPAHRRHVGVVFQDYGLFPHMTALGNVLAAMDVPDRAEAEGLLDMVNLKGLAARKPAQISGGQQQRVALARALARKPQALLLDEPFSAVDRATRERLHDELMALRAHLSMPVVLVTHDIGEAQMLADRMVVIDHGRVAASGTTAAVMSDPVALRRLGLREVAALLPARLAAQEADGSTRLETAGGPIWLPGLEGEPGCRLRIRILAHEVVLARMRPEGLSAQNILAGRVTSILPGEAPGVLVRVAIGEDEIVARITQRARESLALEPGEEVFAILKAMSVSRGDVAPDAAAIRDSDGAAGARPPARSAQ